MIKRMIEMEQAQNDRRLIGALLRVPFQAINARIAEGLGAFGYTDLRPAHFAVFQQMTPAGRWLTELAELAQMTKQSMGALVDYLEERGYVRRVPDPADRRAKIIRLTDKGQDVERRAREIIQAVESEWARGVGEERFQHFRQTLKDIIAQLGTASAVARDVTRDAR
jgi:DNA-binding MarR family transcriptional regulator